MKKQHRYRTQTIGKVMVEPGMSRHLRRKGQAQYYVENFTKEKIHVTISRRFRIHYGRKK